MNPALLSILLCMQVSTIILKSVGIIETWFLAALPSTLIGVIALTSYLGIMTIKTTKKHKSNKR